MKKDAPKFAFQLGASKWTGPSAPPALGQALGNTFFMASSVTAKLALNQSGASRAVGSVGLNQGYQMLVMKFNKSKMYIRKDPDTGWCLAIWKFRVFFSVKAR